MKQHLLARIDRFATTKSRKHWIGCVILFGALAIHQFATWWYAHGWFGELALYVGFLLLSVSLLVQQRALRITFFAVSIPLFVLWLTMFLRLARAS
ncbi:MAG TPA: hypothetical protein VEP30_02790 [Chthoniobacterales bacterium]|nr:hypothetical protein [Chthoniobacterales bacterium]